jgi:hypothetical protein
MADIIPTIGRIVIYKLSAQDAWEINKLRAMAESTPEIDEPAGAGEEYPAMIVQVSDWGRGGGPAHAYTPVNLKVMLDGDDTLHVTIIKPGDKPGDYHWMEYQKGQAAKTEAA